MYVLRMPDQASAGAPSVAPEPGASNGATDLTSARLLIAIVNYRTTELVLDGLEVLAEELRALPGARVVVVDNASGDGSAKRLRGAIEEHAWQGWCSLVASETNGGFAYGNNAAVRAASEPSDYVLLLNPDTRIRPGAIRTLLEFMLRNPRVGVGGSRLEDEDGTQQHSRFRFPNVLGELEATLRLGPLTRRIPGSVVAPPLVTEPHPCDWVAGASLIVRREVLDQVGPMDERYFLYFEEVDLCRRAQLAGWECWYVPDARIVHFVGKSSGVTARGAVLQRRPRYWFASRRRYFVQHHGRAYAALADVAWLVGMLGWRLRKALSKRSDTDPPHLIGDFVRYNFLSPSGWRRPPDELPEEAGR